MNMHTLTHTNYHVLVLNRSVAVIRIDCQTMHISVNLLDKMQAKCNIPIICKISIEDHGRKERTHSRLTRQLIIVRTSADEINDNGENIPNNFTLQMHSEIKGPNQNLQL